MRPIRRTPGGFPRPARAAASLTSIGLLVGLVLPGGAAATGVGVTVTTGTTIVAPPAIEIRGPAGGRSASDPAPLAWWTNDEAMAIVAIGSRLVCLDVSCGAPRTPDTIDASELALGDSSGADQTLDRARVVAVLGSGASESAFTMELTLIATLRDARPGRYAGTLRFSVADPTTTLAADTDPFGMGARPVAGPDGSARITTDVIVVVAP
jgi:hypothetical protein